MGTGVFSPGVKRLGREGDQSLTSNAEVKNPWSYTYTPPYIFMLCLIKDTLRLYGVVLS